MSYTEPTEKEKAIWKEMEKQAKIKRLLTKRYKEKWHPKKPKRPRGLKKGEWKGGKL